MNTSWNSVSYIDPLVTVDDYILFKCLLIGDSAVGKSSCVDRFVDRKFSPDFISTIGVDFKISTFQFDNHVIKLQIWDTAGQERFRAIVASYYRGSHGAIMVYDLTNPESARDLKEVWIHEVERYAYDGIPVILFGNKSDLAINSKFQAQVAETRAIISEFTNQYPTLMNIEGSAKDGSGVEDVFLYLVKMMVDKRRQLRLENAYKPVQLGSGRSVHSNTCCS